MSFTNLAMALVQLPDVSETWIPIVAVVCGTLMVVLIVAIGTITKQRMQEMEHALQLRRMEHERRMKELELELARIQAGVSVRR
jgi:hypothetical protein